MGSLKGTNLTKDEQKALKDHMDLSHIRQSGKVLNKTDGKDLASDLVYEDFNKAQEVVLERIEQSKDIMEAIKLLQLEDMFKRNLSDLVYCYTKWSYKDEKKVYNVDKTLRRITSLAAWISKDQNKDWISSLQRKECLDLYAKARIYSPKDVLTAEGYNSCFLAVKYFGDEFENNDASKLTYFLMLSFSLNRNVADNQFCIIESLKGLSLMKMINLIPRKEKANLNELTYGSAAVKLKIVAIIHDPLWMRVVFKFVSMFLSKKIISRFKILGHNNEKLYKIFSNGKNCVPEGDIWEGTKKFNEKNDMVITP
jgi:hypothetical protein